MAENLIHLFVDIETLGLRESTVILSLAIVPFSFETPVSYDEMVKSGFFVKFDAKEQLEKWKRTTTKGTLDFWKEQPREAKVISLLPSPNDVTLEVGLTKMDEYLSSHPYSSKFNKANAFCFSRGNYFDFPKIEHAWWQVFGEETELPYNGWKIRDCRTVIDVLTGSNNGKFPIDEPEGFVKHHPLHDAAYDATVLKTIFQSLLQ